MWISNSRERSLKSLAMAINLYQESDWCKIPTLLAIIRAGYGEGTGQKAVDSSQNPVGNAQRDRKPRGLPFLLGMVLPTLGSHASFGLDEAVAALALVVLSECRHDWVETSLGNKMSSMCAYYGIINCEHCQYKKLKKICQSRGTLTSNKCFKTAGLTSI